MTSPPPGTPIFDFVGDHPARRAQTFLLTGATGFIGQMLTRALLDEGHSVIIWARKPRRASQLFDGRVACVGDLSELDPATHIDVAINLAGAPIMGKRWSTARKRELVASRVGTTNALVAWLSTATHRPRLLINASAIGYYGPQAQDDLHQKVETSAAGTDFPAQLCEQWETAAKAATTLGIPLAIIRLGLVFGYQGVLPALRIPISLGLGGAMGGGGQAMSWVHIEDVIGSIAWLCRGDGAAIAAGDVAAYNLVAPEPTTQKALTRAAAKLLHRPAFMHVPAWPVRLLLGEQATLLLDGVRVEPARLRQEGYAFRFPALEIALKNLLGNLK